MGIVQDRFISLSARGFPLRISEYYRVSVITEKKKKSQIRRCMYSNRRRK